jgi:hypothetical protein
VAGELRGAPTLTNSIAHVLASLLPFIPRAAVGTACSLSDVLDSGRGQNQCALVEGGSLATLSRPGMRRHAFGEQQGSAQLSSETCIMVTALIDARRPQQSRPRAPVDLCILGPEQRCADRRYAAGARPTPEARTAREVASLFLPSDGAATRRAGLPSARRRSALRHVASSRWPSAPLRRTPARLLGKACGSVRRRLAETALWCCDRAPLPPPDHHR